MYQLVASGKDTQVRNDLKKKTRKSSFVILTIIADDKTMSNINYTMPTIVLIPSETTSAKYI